MTKIPGVLLLFGIGWLGKFVEQSITAYGKANNMALPNIEYVLWAILFGLIVANTVGVPKWAHAGVDTYEFWLKMGIVFQGVRFVLGDMVKLGPPVLLIVAIELAVSIAMMTWLARRFALSPKLGSLLAIGSSICGVSAIIAARGAIEADDEDVSYAIGAILALGAISLIAFPTVGHVLGMSDMSFGMWAGLAVDNTAESVATGALYSETAGKFAVLAKTARNATIGFVVLGYALFWAGKGKSRGIEHKGTFLWQKFPKFVLGFLAISLAATLGWFNVEQTRDIANLSRWAFLLTFAGVGLRTNFAELRKQGLRPLAVGAIGELGIAVLTLGMVLFVGPKLGW